ncbi:hypothetical protein [Streptomyces jeddahensis]|uniref:hypothetical protein n=1 Tax=Streptomyces jeddahensis TaxID=1716141 RepID=UPI00082C2DBC|nr:hypothetical protein [Streptomyces jeddahensis]
MHDGVGDELADEDHRVVDETFDDGRRQKGMRGALIPGHGMGGDGGALIRGHAIGHDGGTLIRDHAIGRNGRAPIRDQGIGRADIRADIRVSAARSESLGGPAIRRPCRPRPLRQHRPHEAACGGRCERVAGQRRTRDRRRSGRVRR